MRYAGLQLSPAEDCWREVPAPQPREALKNEHDEHDLFFIKTKSTCLYFAIFVRQVKSTDLAREAELELHLCLQCWWLCTCRSLHHPGPRLSIPDCHQLIRDTTFHPGSRWGWALGPPSPYREAPQDDPLVPSSPWGQAEYLGALQGSRGPDLRRITALTEAVFQT